MFGIEHIFLSCFFFWSKMTSWLQKLINLTLVSNWSLTLLATLVFLLSLSFLLADSLPSPLKRWARIHNWVCWVWVLGLVYKPMNDPFLIEAPTLSPPSWANSLSLSKTSQPLLLHDLFDPQTVMPHLKVWFLNGDGSSSTWFQSYLRDFGYLGPSM